MITVALENVRSLYNIGAIYRTCEFFGVNQIALIGYSGKDENETTTGIHKKLEKTSLGTIEKIPTLKFETSEQAIEHYKGYQIIGIENNTPNTVALNNFSFEKGEKYLLLFGNETEGLSPQALSSCQLILEIPRIGTHASLNITTCVGIILSQRFK